MLEFWDGEGLLCACVVLFRGVCLVSGGVKCLFGFARIYIPIKRECSSISVGGFNFTQ